MHFGAHIEGTSNPLLLGVREPIIAQSVGPKELIYGSKGLNKGVGPKRA